MLINNCWSKKIPDKSSDNVHLNAKIRVYLRNINVGKPYRVYPESGYLPGITGYTRIPGTLRVTSTRKPKPGISGYPDVRVFSGYTRRVPAYPESGSYP